MSEAVSVVCGATAASCRCALEPGHVGPHSCAVPGCGGEWRGTFLGTDFEIVNLPRGMTVAEALRSIGGGL